MKKLFSLILVALISSQMWAADKYYVKAVVASSCSGMGTVCSTQNGTYAATSSIQSGTSNTSYVYFYAKPGDNYEFVGWSKSASSPTSYLSTSTSYNCKLSKQIKDYGSYTNAKTEANAMIVYAYFREKVTYTVRYKYNINGGSTYTVVQETTGLEYNSTTPYAPFASDFRPADDAQYTYSGGTTWTPTRANKVTGNQDYVTTITRTLRKYTIYFKDGTTTLQDTQFDYGATPVYSGATSKEDENYTYTLTGWDKTIEPVTGEETYIAQYTSTPKVVTKYAVNFSSTGTGTLTVKDGEDALTTGDEVTANKTITIELEAGTHYHLSSLSVKDDSDNDVSLTTVTADAKYTFTLTSDVTISAAFTEDNKYKVDITAPSEGTGTLVVKDANNNIINDDDLVYTGTSITVTATPATHYTGGAVITMGGNTVNTTTFTLTAAATIGTNFVEDGKSIVNITTPSHGEISVLNGSTPVNNGDEVYTGTVLTVTATADVANHYEFKSWNDGTPALTNDQFTLTGNVTIGATFGLEEYTISFYNGENLLSSSSAAYGSTPVQPATPTKIVGDDEYAFEGWSKTQDGAVVANWAENAKVTGNQNYYAKFSSTAVTKYTITVGALTNCKSMTLTCDGNTIEVPAEGGAYKYAEGKEIVVDAIPARGYHFTQWSDANTDNSRLIDGIDDDMTLTPTFAGNTPFPMSDEWEQDDIAGEYASYKNKVLDVTLTGRQFTVGQWATLSLPFDYTLTEEDGALYKSVYKFNSMEMAGESSVFIDFVRTYDIKANEPYLVVPRGNVNNPTFYGVKQLEDAAEKTLTSDNNVYFVSSLWKQTISGNEYFYVSSNSQLRFAHSLGTTIKANRAFFHIEGSSNAPRRVRIVLDGVEVEKEIAEDGSLEDVQNVRKYMEDGRLVIECNGVRMDATGKKIN